VSWDIGVPEWGLITGYDDDTQTLFTLSINAGYADPTSPAGDGTQMPYDMLEKRELPILSVLTVTGKSDKSREDTLRDTKRLAAFHLNGGEWCENAQGLKAYPALIRHFEGEFDPDLSWKMEYFLGTYGALKYYAWKYFDKMGETELAGIYMDVYETWMQAFKIKTGQDISRSEVRSKIAGLLKSAHESETRAAGIMGAGG
jgi:hypothetical protein